MLCMRASIPISLCSLIGTAFLPNTTNVTWRVWHTSHVTFVTFVCVWGNFFSSVWPKETEGNRIMNKGDKGRRRTKASTLGIAFCYLMFPLLQTHWWILVNPHRSGISTRFKFQKYCFFSCLSLGCISLSCSSWYARWKDICFRDHKISKRLFTIFIWSIRPESFCFGNKVLWFTRTFEQIPGLLSDVSASCVFRRFNSFFYLLVFHWCWRTFGTRSLKITRGWALGKTRNDDRIETVSVYVLVLVRNVF